MYNAIYLMAVVLVPTALYYLLARTLLLILRRPFMLGTAVLATIAIASFASALARTTGYPFHIHLADLLNNPVRVLLLLVGFAFCVAATRAYEYDHQRRTEPTNMTGSERLSHYVQAYGNHLQLYGLGLAMILLGV